MYKLGLLIACLLVGFKSISQIDIQSKDSVVVLSERQARAVATDLVHYDFAKNIIKQQEVRIKNYQNKEIEFKNQLDVKDSIIFYQKNIIDINKQIIKNKKSFGIHAYGGVQSIQLTLKEPLIYARVMLEFTRFSVGGRYYIQPNNFPGYGIILEYNLF